MVWPTVSSVVVQARQRRVCAVPHRQHRGLVIRVDVAAQQARTRCVGVLHPVACHTGAHAEVDAVGVVAGASARSIYRNTSFDAGAHRGVGHDVPVVAVAGALGSGPRIAAFVDDAVDPAVCAGGDEPRLIHRGRNGLGEPAVVADVNNK